MFARGSVRIAAGLLCGVLAVSACEFEEQRPFNYEKGVYLGKPHTPLDKETLNDLRARALMQSGIAVSGGGGGGSGFGTPASVRPPASASPDALRQRATFQRSN